MAKRQQRRHNDNRATRSVRVVSARCDQPTSLAYLVAQLDFQFMMNITWQKEGNRQWANGRQREKQVQPTSLLVAQLDVQFMRNMTWQKLQPTHLPWIIALLFGATEEELIFRKEASRPAHILLFDENFNTFIPKVNFRKPFLDLILLL